jgi:hypothetical protein
MKIPGEACFSTLNGIGAKLFRAAGAGVSSDLELPFPSVKCIGFLDHLPRSF